MTTIALHGAYESEVSFKKVIQKALLQAWTAFVEARANRARMLVSFYTVK